MECTKCGSEKVNRSGFVKGEQRYKCKDCGRQFVPTRRRGRSETEKLTAVLLYINGLSLRTIGRLLNVSAAGVLKWVRQYAIENYEKPRPNENAVVVELDEMWHYLHAKKTSSGYGRLIVALPVSSLTGNAAVVIEKHLDACLSDSNDGM
jgi:Transposase and inactivated derivatives